MDEISATLEAVENQLMRAWMRGDEKDVRKLVAKDCIITVGTAPLEILDRPSFVRAMGGGFQCCGFRMKEIAVRKYGKMAWFVCNAELELRVGREDWQGSFMMTDLWKRSRLNRRWMLAERSLCQIDAHVEKAASLRSLQLWH